MKTGASIKIDNASIVLDGHQIVSDAHLTIEPGEFVCLLGPSGCGKSTLLNAIAGFVPATGSILVDGKMVAGPGVDRGMVFQSSEALFPWLTVQENVEYGARIRGVPAPERAEMARKYLRLVGLTPASERFPDQLSGGMRQRTQLARVLANEPSVILMDEPFAALDAQTREILQQELHRIWRATNATIVFVTHDISEAIILADQVVTMTAGPNARIKSSTRINLLHPRDLTSPAAAELQRMLRDDISREVSQTLFMQGLTLETAE